MNRIIDKGFEFTTYCSKLINFKSVDDIKDVLEPYFVVGNCTNTFFTEDFNGTILRSDIKDICFDGDLIKAGSGLDLNEVIQFYINNKIGHPVIYNIFDIPGTVGGAVTTNCGHDGYGMSNIVQKVECYDMKSKQIKIINDCDFSYRNSLFKHNNRYVILYVWFKYNHKQLDLKKLEEIKNKRKSFIPQRFTLGCFWTSHEIQKLVNNKILNNHINNCYQSSKFPCILYHDGTGTKEDMIKLYNLIANKIDLELEIEIK